MKFKKILTHTPWLYDHVRLTAFQKAIHEVIRKGDIVADIGTGCGILTFFALQAGAQKVYAIEQDEGILEEAKRLAEVNKMAERTIFIKGSSDQIELPEKVDVVIRYDIGNFGINYDHKFINCTVDFRKRYLKPKGLQVPSWLDLCLVPVAFEGYETEIHKSWTKDFFGLDFSLVGKSITSLVNVVDCSGKVKELAPVVTIARLDLNMVDCIPPHFLGRWRTAEEGYFNGYAGYIRVGLSKNVILSTSWNNPSTHLQQVFFPLEESVKVEKGDWVDCKLTYVPRKEHAFWIWETNISRNGTTLSQFSQSNLDLMEIDKESIVMRQGSFVPVLSGEGEIYREVMGLCDGHRTIEEIVRALLEKYPARYTDKEHALDGIYSILRKKVQTK